MLRSLLIAFVTLGTMIYVFFGLRGLVAEHWPGMETGVGEVLIYCSSVIYGFWFGDWVSKKFPQKIDQHD